MSKSSLTLEADFALGGERRIKLWRGSIDLVGVRLRVGMDAARLAVVAVGLTMAVGFILVGEGARGVDICILVGEGERGDILGKEKTADSGAGDGVLTPSVLDFPNPGRLSRFGVGDLIFGLAAAIGSPILKLRERKMLNRLLGLDVGAEIGGGLVVRKEVWAWASFSLRFCFFAGRSSVSPDWVDWAEACLAADSAGDTGMVMTVAAGVDGLAGCVVGKERSARALGP